LSFYSHIFHLYRLSFPTDALPIYSALIRSENIKVTSTTPGVSLEAVLFNPLSNHFLLGNNTSGVHFGSNGVTNTTTGTYWTVTTSIPVTNISIEYYASDAYDIAGREPFLMLLK